MVLWHDKTIGIRCGYDFETVQIGGHGPNVAGLKVDFNGRILLDQIGVDGVRQLLLRTQRTIYLTPMCMAMMAIVVQDVPFTSSRQGMSNGASFRKNNSRVACRQLEIFLTLDDRARLLSNVHRGDEDGDTGVILLGMDENEQLNGGILS